MIRYALPLASLAIVAQPAVAAEIQITAENPVIELSVTESVTADPDVADLSAGVTTSAATAVEALRQNSEQMERLIARIEALGIDRDDIQTTGFNLTAEYDWDDTTRQQRFRGYRVANRVTVRLRDVDRTGRVLDALVEAGATDLGGISWSIDNPVPAQDQAREAAFATSRARALNYAHMSGYSEVRLLEVSEAFSQSGPPQPMFRQFASEAADSSVPVRPGRVETAVTLTVKYEMVR